MSKASRAARAVAEESSPVTFWQRLRRLPVVERIFRILDRFL